MTNRGMISEQKYRIELGGRGAEGELGRARARRHGRVNNYTDEGRERENRGRESERESEGERGNRNPEARGREG